MNFLIYLFLLFLVQISLCNEIDLGDEDDLEEDVDSESITDHFHKNYDNSKDELLNKTSTPVKDGTKYTEYRRNRITGEIYPFEYTYYAAKPYNPRKELGQDANSSIFTVDGEQLDRHIMTTQNVLVYVRRHLGSPGSVSRQFYSVAIKAKENKLPVKFIRICPPYFENFNHTKYLFSMPSLVLFKDYGKEEITYEEPLEITKRNSDHVYDWLVSRLGSLHVSLITKEAVDDFIRNTTMSVIGFFREFNQTAIKEFDLAIQHIEGCRFGLVIDSAIISHYNTSYKYDVMIYHENGKKVYPIFPKDVKIEDYFNVNYLVERMIIFKNPPVTELHPSEVPTIESSFIKYDLMMFIDGGDPDKREILQVFTRVAEKFRENVKCYLIDFSDKNCEKLASERGVRIAPGFKRQRLVMSLKQNQTIKYRPEPDFWEDGTMNKKEDKTQKLLTEEEIESFVKTVLEGKAKRFYITEKETKDEDIIIEGAEENAYGTPKVVRKIIGRTWREFCKDKDMTSVVYYTAGWCMGCNHTIYTRLTRLGLHYGRKGRKDIQFGFSDYTLNEYPYQKNTAVPRLKLYPKNSDEELDLNGDEKYCNIKKFIETQGKNSTCDPTEPRDPENIDVLRKWTPQKINKDEHDEL